MRKNLSYGALLAGTVFTLFSCQKVNLDRDDLDEKRRRDNDLCLISSFSYSNSAVPTQTIFTNRFDLSGRSLEVEAGVFSGGTIISNENFNVTWTSDGISFADAAAPQNVILIASFDSRGRIEKITHGNVPSQDFLPTRFEYRNNRLTGMHIDLAGNTESADFEYDQKGNLISITDRPTQSVPIPGKVEYTYSNQKADNQFYFDEPRRFLWNSFSLLQYIGLFPELQPVNLRTSTRVTWGNNYLAYHMGIVNHHLDHDKKLISYDIASPGSETPVFHFNINWTCNSGLVDKGGDN